MVDVPSGETVEVIETVDSGDNYSVRVSTSNVRLNVRKNLTGDGPLVESGEIAIVSVPAGESVWFENVGGGTATIEYHSIGGSEPGQFSVNLSLVQELSIGGATPDDPVFVDMENAETTAAITDAIKAHPDDLTEIALQVKSVSGQPIQTATPNESAVATGSVTGDGSFASQAIPDGFAMAIKADPGNASTAFVDGFPLGSSEFVTLAVDNADVPALTFDDQTDTVHYIVEASA